MIASPLFSISCEGGDQMPDQKKAVSQSTSHSAAAGKVIVRGGRVPRYPPTAARAPLRSIQTRYLPLFRRAPPIESGRQAVRELGLGQQRRATGGAGGGQMAHLMRRE